MTARSDNELHTDGTEERVDAPGARGDGDTSPELASPSVPMDVGGAQDSPPDEPLDPVAELEEEVSSLRERLLRQAAEFQNFRKRVDQERKSDVKFGQSLVLQQFLDVYDDLRRSLEAARDADDGEDAASNPVFVALREGMDLVFKKFSDELERFGVQPIDAVGKPFNEDEHEAMLQQPAPNGTAAGIVLEEIQKGYRMGDRVLRHTKVVVSA